MHPTQFFQVFIFGLTQGAIFALVALGYTMVYGIIELINFAHGDVFTLGAYIGTTLLGFFAITEGTFTAINLIALIIVFPVVMLIMGGINITIERVAYRPLRNAPRLAPLITAIGMSFFLEGVMFLWRGPATVHFPDILPTQSWYVAGVFFGVRDIFVVVVGAVLVSLLAVFINQTKLGKAMRATAQDRDAAGFRSGLIAFTAAVFGGIGNIPGAAIGGLVIGLTAAFSDSYIGSKWTQVVIFGILIGVLVFRPTGLLGMRVPEK
ncbi:MAG: branched-chain amino acid ABC transporter permease [Chloroflexi bacterium]|nr:MAG: branched-chain amino acid ABC transporter permease [Chloroflexota bacterium]